MLGNLKFVEKFWIPKLGKAFHNFQALCMLHHCTKLQENPIKTLGGVINLMNMMYFIYVQILKQIWPFQKFWKFEIFGRLKKIHKNWNFPNFGKNFHNLDEQDVLCLCANFEANLTLSKFWEIFKIFRFQIRENQPVHTLTDITVI